MIKKIFLVLIIVLNVSAKEKHYIGEDPMKALFLQLASSSFFAEFEHDKNLTIENKKDIAEIKKDIKIIKKNIMVIVEELNRLNKAEKSVVIKPNTSNLSNANRYNITKVKALVKRDGVAIRLKPQIDSMVIKRVDRGYEVDVEFCDEFGWCKIKEGYIAGFLITTDPSQIDSFN